MQEQIVYPSQHKTNTTNRVARHLLRELELLEEQHKRIRCDDPVTTEGAPEQKAVCTDLDKAIRRIKAELRSMDTDVPRFLGGAMRAM